MTRQHIGDALEGISARAAAQLAEIVPFDAWVERHNPSRAEVELYQQLRAHLESIVANPIIGVTDTSLLIQQKRGASVR